MLSYGSVEVPGFADLAEEIHNTVRPKGPMVAKEIRHAVRRI